MSPEPGADSSTPNRLTALTRFVRQATALLGAAVDAVALVVLAPRCAVCRGALESARTGAVCADCWARVRLFALPFCRRCGTPVGRQALDACNGCHEHPPPVDRGASAGPYEGRLREIVHALKYGGRRSVAAGLAARMAGQAGDLLEGVEAVVPVPLHWRRRQARGFNQAAEIARHLGLPVRPALARRRATPSQIGLSAEARRRNVRGAFRLAGFGRRGRRRRQRMVQNRIVLIVDDVSTTGATLDACAAVLKAAGAREVRALTAARTVSRRSR